MGFEITYSYHPRNEDGGYNKDCLETLKKRVGKADEDIPYEKLAGTIMSQLARRDIWVLDVEVYEFAKKRVSFKESKNGLVLGGRKFTFDDCGHLAVQEVVAPPPTVGSSIVHCQPTVNGPPPGVTNVNVADIQLLKKRPLRYEIFQPDPVFIDPPSVRRMAFTVGDKYPIYAEKAAGNDLRLGMNYTTVDNKGNKQVLNDKYFVPATSLIGDVFNERRDLDLGFRGESEYDMPKIR